MLRLGAAAGEGRTSMNEPSAVEVAAPSTARRDWASEGGGYLLASAVALLVDLGTFGLFARWGGAGTVLPPLASW